MKDFPIIFSAPMVRALIEGRKTQTRRVLKPYLYDRALRPGMNGYKPITLDLWQIDNDGPFFRVPYAPGDRLYVREAHAFGPLDPPPVIYRAATEADGWEVGPQARWRPSIHMPRWASRITLTVTEVRVQQLQEISEADAVAEGVESLPDYWVREDAHIGGSNGDWIPNQPPVPAYRDLWNSLHGPDAWDTNPWVVAINFTVALRNIDAEGAA